MARSHHYSTTVVWTGNRGTGTSSYRSYDRAHMIANPGKPTIAGSADPTFRGDTTSWNPEELLIASLAQCHLLWYLHLAADTGVIVTAYADEPLGTLSEADDGSGQFAEVVLRPTVTVAEDGMIDAAQALHDAAHATCFIARSVSFPVRHQPKSQTEPGVT